MEHLHLSTAQIPAQRGRIPGLDGLRALSIGIVMLGHFFLAGTAGLGLSALGVYIFFVISGFLITRLLLAELKADGTVSAGRFYFRRFLRLYPVLVVYMVIACTVAALTSQPTPLIEVGSVFAYFTNYLMSARELHFVPTQLPIGVLWSLSVEEHFYFLMPLFLLLVRGDIRKMAWFASAMIVLPLILRCIYVHVWPEMLGTNYIYMHSETRFDSIAWGVLIAVLCEFRNRERIISTLSSRWVFALGMALLLVSYVIRDPVFKDTLRYTLRSAGCLALVCATVFGERMALLQRIMNFPFFVWIGRLSYSLYIWHGGTEYFLKAFHIPLLTGIAGGIEHSLGTLVLACLSYYLIEQPALRFKTVAAKPKPAPFEPNAPRAGTSLSGQARAEAASNEG